MNELNHNPEALEELKIIGPELMKALERKLEENQDTLIWSVQIHGDHLHARILAKGKTYWYGLRVRHKDGTESKLTRVCDYLGIGDIIRGQERIIQYQKTR